MHAQKLFTNPDVNDPDDTGPEFYSFILEGDDPPMQSKDVDDASLTDDEYYRKLSFQFYSYKRPSEKLINNLNKKQPKSVIESNFYQIQSQKRSRGSQQIESLIPMQQNKQQFKLKLKPRVQNKDTVSTAASLIYNKESQNIIHQKINHLKEPTLKLQRSPNKQLYESLEHEHVNKQKPQNSQNKVTLKRSPYLQQPFRKITLKNKGKNQVLEKSSFNQNNPKTRLQTYGNADTSYELTQKYIYPQGNQLNLYFQMAMTNESQNNINQSLSPQKKEQQIKFKSKRNIQN